jgi:hypothetical protein
MKEMAIIYVNGYICDNRDFEICHRNKDAFNVRWVLFCIENEMMSITE